MFNSESAMSIEKIIKHLVVIVVLFLWIIGFFIAASIFLNGDTEKTNLATGILTFQVLFSYFVYVLLTEK